jgi:hypothetical protein
MRGHHALPAPDGRLNCECPRANAAPLAHDKRRSDDLVQRRLNGSGNGNGRLALAVLAGDGRLVDFSAQAEPDSLSCGTVPGDRTWSVSGPNASLPFLLYAWWLRVDG